MFVDVAREDSRETHEVFIDSQFHKALWPMPMEPNCIEAQNTIGRKPEVPIGGLASGGVNGNQSVCIHIIENCSNFIYEVDRKGYGASL